MSDKAGLSPARFEDLALHIQSSASQLTQRYAELHEFSSQRQVTGASERVSGGGTSDMVGSTLVSNERALSYLAAASTQAEHAWNSLKAAHGKLTSIERVADARAERNEGAQPAERLREAETRGVLVRILIRNKVARIAEHNEDMAKLDAKIRPLFHHVDVDDADDLIQALQVRINQIRTDGEKEALRLDREIRRLRSLIAKEKEKAKVKAATKIQQSQWQRGA